METALNYVSIKFPFSTVIVKMVMFWIATTEPAMVRRHIDHHCPAVNISMLHRCR